MNVLSFDGTEATYDGHAWSSRDPALASLLERFTRTLSIGPGDGMPGPFVAVSAAREFRVDVLELDPPPAPDGRIY